MPHMALKQQYTGCNDAVLPTLCALALALSALRWSQRAFLACLSRPADDTACLAGAAGSVASAEESEVAGACLALFIACSSPQQLNACLDLEQQQRSLKRCKLS